MREGIDVTMIAFIPNEACCCREWTIYRRYKETSAAKYDMTWK